MKWSWTDVSECTVQLLAKVTRVRVLTPCPLVHRSGDGVHAASNAVRNLAGRTHPGRVSYGTWYPALVWSSFMPTALLNWFG